MSHRLDTRPRQGRRDLLGPVTSMPGIEPIMRAMCPNCGGPISASRLEEGLPCERCLPSPTYGGPETIGEELARKGTLQGYAWVYELEREFNEFKAFFESRTGSPMWSAQASWARRLLMLDSLAIIAPTGVGKTTLLMVYAVYRAEKDGWRILYLVPTQNLVRQIYEKLRALAGDPDNIVYYIGSMARKAREKALNRIKHGNFRILVVTTSFLQRGFELLAKNAPFQLVLVDDVDSLLRSGSNVERVLLLMGFNSNTIRTAEELVKTRLRFYAALQAGNEEKTQELQARLAELEAKLALEERAPLSQLVIASATGRPRGLKHFLFKELLGFEVGGGSDYMRSVTDTYRVAPSPVEEAVRIVRELGAGGVVFVSQLLGKSVAKLVGEKLRRAGVRAEVALAGTRRAVRKLEKGETDVVVGVASRYGVIVRGIDLPERIRYAVFVEVPARRMRLSEALSSPRRQLSLLLALRDLGVDNASEMLRRLSRLVERFPDTRIVSLAYRGKVEAEGLLAEIVTLMREAAVLIESGVRRVLEERGGVLRIGGNVLVYDEEDIWLLIPDAPTYLQASGRTSRLYQGVMTHGLSVVVSSRKELVEALEARLQWYTQSGLVPFEQVDLKDVVRRVGESRKGKGKRVNVRTVLMVVESPTKARTIAWFWGRPGKRRMGRLTVYETSVADPVTETVYLLMVTATRGHLLELAIDEDESLYGVKVEDGIYKPVYTSIKKCLRCGYIYAGDGPCPRCGSSSVYSSSAIISALRKLATEVDEIVIATDPDREGEKIAWDVYLALKPYNSNIKRGRFHEVTRNAILEALRTADKIDRRLVQSQIVRRIEDRWIGFSLSRHLWAIYGKRWLGAGRVQTPVLGWAVERYKEWREKKGYGTLLREPDTGDKLYVFTRQKPSWTPGETIEAEVKHREEWEEESHPPPPFTTDELLYEASRRLGFSASQTMRLAQDLFESGLITYHRTDSTRVSPAGMAVAKQYLESKGMGALYQGRSWGEGGAHEAIRPTRPLDVDMLRQGILDGSIRVQARLTWAHFRLYDLIFRRFIASQSKADRVKRARIVLSLPGGLLVEKEAVVWFEGSGYTKIMPPRKSSIMLLALKQSRIQLRVDRVSRTSEIRLYKPGDLVRKMKEEGIGRPSTYAKAIEANRRHGYIVLSKKHQYVVPTKTGIEVYEHLSANFASLVSVETSRRMEEILDKVASGEIDPAEALRGVITMISESLAAGGAEDGLIAIA